MSVPVNPMIQKARNYIREAKIDEAMICYGEVGKGDPEAKFFLDYEELREELKGTNLTASQLTARLNAYKKFNVDLEDAVKAVIESDAELADKQAVLIAIVTMYTPIPEFVYKTRNISDRNHIMVSGVLGLYTLGEMIVEAYGDIPEIAKLAVKPWKEGVRLQRKWYGHKYGIEPEVYAEKIKAFEPDYVMPQKAGCVSFG